MEPLYAKFIPKYSKLETFTWDASLFFGTTRYVRRADLLGSARPVYSYIHLAGKAAAHWLPLNLLLFPTVFELGIIELGVETVFRKQFLMGTGFHDVAVAEHQNLVGVADR